MRKRLFILFVSVFVIILSAFLVLFPGRRALFAATLGTGLGLSRLQENIDALEEKAIHKKKFTRDERQFLTELYDTMATGALIFPPLRQSGKLMAHYLNKSGEAFELESSIFTDNRKVQKRMARLRKQARNHEHFSQTRCTRPFHMPDPSVADSVFGLYWGTLCVTPERSGDSRSGNSMTLKWRASVPWKWPSYEALKKKYGKYHAESFPLPNIRSLMFGKKYALRIDNGLGEYLARLNLAEEFVAFAEWEERL